MSALTAAGVTKTPGRIMGHLWYHGTKPATRRAILRGEYDFAPQESMPASWMTSIKREWEAEGITVDDPAKMAAHFWSKLSPEARADFIRKHGKLDPQALPKPIDLRGYDHTLVRVVPEIDKLIELQVRLPRHIWNDLHDIAKDWPDVEIDEKARRIVRRGKKNAATNLFIDGE
jgi:hypothetical protein